VSYYKSLTQMQAQALARNAEKEAGTEKATLAHRTRRDLAGLPLIMGEACKLPPSSAAHLESGSGALRKILDDARGRTLIPHTGVLADKLQSADDGSAWLKPEAVPAMMQLLMAENVTIREVLVEQLERIEGKEATAALANRAVFDLHPRVREAAIRA